MRNLYALTATSAMTAGMLLLAIVSIGNANIQSADATIIVKDHGASGFTPKEDPKGPGWMPNGAEEDAPGHLAPTPCPACDEAPGWDPDQGPAEFSPGDDAQDAGIIGPD